MSKTLIALSVVLAGMLWPVQSEGGIITFPMFGKPVVSEETIVFTDHAIKTPRIIAIDRESGKKKWELTDSKRRLEVCLPPHESYGDNFIIQKDNDVFFCNAQTGTTRLAYRSGLTGCWVQAYRDSLVLINGIKGRTRYLQLVDLRSGKKLWEIAEVSRIIAAEKDLIICIRETILYNKKYDSLETVNPRLTAISGTSSRIVWERDLNTSTFSFGVIMGEHVLIHDENALTCYDRNNGKLVSRLRKSEAWDSTISIGKQNDHLIVCQTGLGSSYGSAIYEVSVPQLEVHRVLKTKHALGDFHISGDLLIVNSFSQDHAYDLNKRKMIWTRRKPSVSTIHGGYMYNSELDTKLRFTRITRTHIETGKTKLLYREDLPETYQNKTNRQELKKFLDPDTEVNPVKEGKAKITEDRPDHFW